MKYNFTLKETTRNYEVMVDPFNKYGYFEHLIYGDARGGGLWFDSEDKLVDYDGVFFLPEQVINALLGFGYIVDDVFFPDYID